MKTILTVIKKEITDTLRDKRTLMSAIVLPAILFPLLFWGIAKFQKSIINKEKQKELKIAFINAPEDASKRFKDGFKVVSVAEDAIEKAIQSDSLDAAIVFDKAFQTNIDSLGTGTVNLHFKSTDLLIEKRINEKLEGFKNKIMRKRMRDLNISQDAIEPIKMVNVDVSTPKEQLGKTIGGIIPYLFIILCFTGCMYPALDLITGEKERGTMETLLTVPASRLKILIGKTITIALIGLAAAFMAIAGIFVGIKFMDGVPPDFLDSITDIVSPRFVIMLFAMLIPLSIFFGGLLSAIAIRANSFKEAQSYVSPLMFVIVIPAIMAMLPGVELTWKTAFIPIANIALATKEIIAGTIQMPMYIAVVASLIILALLAVFFSYKQFSKESMVLK